MGKKLDYQEIFDCGYCDCSICEHKVTDGYEYLGDEDWYCTFESDEFPELIDNMDMCPLGDKMPLDSSFEEDEELKEEFYIEEE